MYALTAATLLATTTLLPLLLSLGWVIYTLYFRPLSKYPGPLLAKVTTLYATYHGWKGDIHLDMHRAHARYGPYVRCKPNSVLFNTAEGLHDIYKRPGMAIKSKVYSPMVHRAPNTFTIRGGKAHARRRRIMAQGLSDKALRGYEPRIMVHVNKFCQSLGSSLEPKNMAVWCNYLSFDIMADVVFSAKYVLLGTERFRYVLDAIDVSNVRMGTLVQAGGWASWKRLEKAVFQKSIEARNRFVRFVTRVVTVRIGKEKDVLEDDIPDLFSRLRDAHDPDTGDKLTVDEIAAESTTLIVAESDTSSTSMCSALFYLAHNPAARARATEEVRAKFTHYSDVCTGPALSSCQYLRACIDEAFRMSPSVGTCLYRELVSQDATIDGHAIPAGYDVGTGVYAIHHSPTYFTDPFVYRPERWIPGEGDTTHESVERGHSVLNPFSVGVRSCLGKAMAVMELQLAVAAVLASYDFELAQGKLGQVGAGQANLGYGRHRSSEYQLYDHITSQKHGPWLVFKARKY
ncbi:hypothetical protein DL767_011316 [Monosporascus sp. MG133]|nr:hypothetical protein DL767_011316 [Monosporascus sp. MG133]